MTAPRWAGLSHAEIAAMVAAGPGPSASAGAERAWRDAAAALTEVHRELSGRVRTLPGVWSGSTADGVTVAFGSLGGWVASAAVDAGRTADALATQAGLAADLRARMPSVPAPAPPETAPAGPALLDDWAAADLAAGNSAGRAAELMVRYDDDTRVTGAPWTGWGASPVVTRDGGAAPTSPTVPAPPPGAPLPGPGGHADPVPPDGTGPGTTVFAGLGLGGLTAAVLTGNGQAGVPGARPVDVGGPSSRPDPADVAATDSPRSGGPGTGTGPGTGDTVAGPASPAGDAGTRGDGGGAGSDGAGSDRGGTAVTAAVLAGGALGGAGILVGATIRRERRAGDGRAPCGDGTTSGHPRPGDDRPGGQSGGGRSPDPGPRPGDGSTPGPEGPGGDYGDQRSHGDQREQSEQSEQSDQRDQGGQGGQGGQGDTPTSGAEHRPPSGDATTSGTRAPSGAPAPGATDGAVPSTHGALVRDGDSGSTGDTGPDGDTARHGCTPDGSTPHGSTPGGPAPGGLTPDGPAADGPTSDRPSPDGTAGGTASGDLPPHSVSSGGPDGPLSAAHHSVTTGDVAAHHGPVAPGRNSPPPLSAPGDPAGVPVGGVGAVPVSAHPVAAAAGAPAGPRTPAWRLVADEHAVPDDPPEQPDAGPDPGVLRPDARWRGRG